MSVRSTKTATPRTDAVVAELGPNMTVDLCRELERELNALRQSGPAEQVQPEALPAALSEGDTYDWKSAALRLGEQICATGPRGYYEFTPAQWLDWAEHQLPQSKAGADDARDAARYRYLKSFALPRYIVKVESGDTASLYKAGEAVVYATSWDELDRALDNCAPPSSSATSDQGGSHG